MRKKIAKIVQDIIGDEFGADDGCLVGLDITHEVCSLLIKRLEKIDEDEKPYVYYRADINNLIKELKGE